MPKQKPTRPVVLSDPQKVAGIVAIATQGASAKDIAEFCREHKIEVTLLQQTVDGLRHNANAIERAIRELGGGSAEDDDEG